MRNWRFIPIALLGLTFGCAANKPPSQQAVQQWNDARAGVLIGVADEQYQAGHFDRAQQTVDEGLRMDANNVRLHILAAKLAIEDGHLEIAEQHLTAARKTDSHNAEVDYLGGVICQRWQQPQKAYDYYAAAATKAPTELAYLLAKAETLVALGHRDQALALLQSNVVTFEHSGALRDCLGQLLMQQGRAAQAADILRQATILSPDDITIREHLALALYADRQYRPALEILQRLIDGDACSKRSDLLEAMASCQQHLGQIIDSRHTLETAVEVNPTSQPLWLELAKTCATLRDLPSAQLDLNKAIALDTANPQAHLLLGYVQLRIGRLDDALTSFRTAHDLDRSDTLSLCMVGVVLDRMGKPREAKLCFSKALQIDPADELAGRLMARSTPEGDPIH